MNKSQAMVAMSRGERVTHRDFDEHEWATMDTPDIVIHENGAKMPLRAFWELRTASGWEDGWEIWKDDTDHDKSEPKMWIDIDDEQVNPNI